MNTFDTQQPSLYGAIITTYVLAAIAVALRFWSRKLKKIGWWHDDWFILLSLFFAAGFTIDCLLWIALGGLGKHATAQSLQMYPYYLFAGEFMYPFTLLFAKLAIMALYLRIFGNANIKHYIAVLAACVILWVTAVLITTCAQCIPIQLVWDTSIKGFCGVDQRKWFLGTSIPNIITDVALLALPLPYLWKLKISFPRKLELTGMFMLGGVVCVASIMRLVTLFSEVETDLSWNLSTVAIWSVVELNLAIVSACLPCLRPVWSLIWKGSVETHPTSTSTETRRAMSHSISHGTRPSIASRSMHDDVDMFPPVAAPV